MKSASFEKQGHLPVGLAIGFELGWKTTQLQDAAKIHCVAWNDDRVSSMDVLSFVQPDETALQLIARTRTDPLPTGVFFLGTVRPGQILEVAGPSGVGKTTLLLQIVASAILPRDYEGQPVGGLNEHVLFLDLDNKLDVLRLMEMLIARLRPAFTALSRPSDGEDTEALMHDCLSRFHLVRCGSSFELLAVLKTVDAFLSRLQNEGGIHLLLVDNIAAFHWLDAAVRAEPAGPGMPSALTLQSVHSAVAEGLRALAKQLKLAVVVTKHAFRTGPNSGEEEQATWQHREVMCKQWTDAVSQRLLLKHVGGGVGNLPSVFAARPDSGNAGARSHAFAITDSGIVPRQQQI